MKWNLYTDNFTAVARAQGFDSEAIEQCLQYARILHDKKLPIVYDVDHFSSLVGYDKKLLQAMVHAPEHFYRTFHIPKKNGHRRRISEPLPTLKSIQRWILKKILEKSHVSPYAKAYIRNKSVKDNAYFHTSQSQILTLDITNFFGSISLKSIFLIFRNFGYTSELSGMFASLCCLNNRLPQGAPTSPTLSNIFMKDADERIVHYVRKGNIRYTRYADDISFSGRFSVGNMIAFVKYVLASKDLSLNPKKTRLMKPHKCQEVTGIVVNRKLQAPRKLRRDIRQSLFYIKRFGLDSHMEKIGEKRAHYIEHLLGQANFIIFVNPMDKEMKKYRDELIAMMSNKT